MLFVTKSLTIKKIINGFKTVLKAKLTLMLFPINFKEHLANYTKDRRTVLCKEACKQLIAIIKYRQKEFYLFVGYFIELYLEIIIRLNIQVTSQSSDECVTIILTSIPESAYTYLILRSLVSAANDSNFKYIKSKEHIMKYVRHLMLQSHNATLLKDNIYTDELCAIIAIGCEDADATVRSQSFNVLKTLKLNVDANQNSPNENGDAKSTN
ncbi:hypothetical protein RFI_26346 [Reticulomyxa filosa]|uniref:CLASP N-terminal domain-containing protein n=1 Tax=Reticulomyxa filosa TaxID=46433 RepID=X6MDB1_RETFI|nr:hypothetical protein RFI_26346 [Reticulomyxa filosa]|eukprot:ETO11030.1 hypothetical protein RFI_26346 [Reticulomyxa filosa]